MDSQQDLGFEAVKSLVRLWQADPDRMVPTETGFDWWPSRFRVSVKASPVDPKHGERAWRVTVRTAVLRGVDIVDAKRKALLDQLGSIAPSYGVVYTPRQILDKYDMEDEGTVEFQSSVYVRESNVEWIPDFLGRMAILQAIEAHVHGEPTAELLHARLDVSGPGCGPADDFVDDILGVAGSIYVPDGRQPSRWEDSAEFAEIAERHGQNDLCYGNGGPDGLTLETPMGADSALVKLRHDVQHPRLGSGLLATLQLPLSGDAAATVDDAAWYNFFESIQATNIPQLGSWHSKSSPRGGHSPAHAIFVPNSLYQPGIATNLALMQVGRAGWIRQKFFPDLEDQTMADILRARWEAIGNAE